jgi:drug/metabolite transporter (DMT)-like permease
LQVKAQKITAPAVAAILFSMEAVFAALADFVINRQGFTLRELTGCVLVLAAVIVSQVPGKRR